MPFEYFLTQATSQLVLEVGNAEINLWWWPIIFTFVRDTLILITIVLFVATVMVFSRFQSLRTRIYNAIEEALESGKLSKGKTQRKWEEIRGYAESENREENEKALFESGKLLDDALKMANFSGDNLEMRIKKIPDSQIDFKEDIIWAYRLGEKIKAGESAQVDREEIRRGIHIFERTLKDLNIL